MLTILKKKMLHTYNLIVALKNLLNKDKYILHSISKCRIFAPENKQRVSKTTKRITK